MSDFFAMGGYAFFVWSAYAITALMLLLNLYLAFRKSQHVTKDLNNQNKLHK